MVVPTPSTTKRIRSGGPMTSPSQALTPAIATERGVGGPGQGLATGPAARPTIDPVVHDRAAARRAHDLRLRRARTVGERAHQGAGAVVVALAHLVHPLGQGQVGDGVHRGGQPGDLVLQGEALGRAGGRQAGDAVRVAERRVGEHRRFEQGIAVDDVAALLGAPPANRQGRA